MLKAHEIITVISLNGVGGKFMEKYIVLATTTSKAVSLLNLRDGEEVLNAHELVHKVVTENKYEL